ncbi:hypothetical protein R1flu_016824 [Riccia fluitans]|uniref:Uncharacterized protein n=1 Tax=Riccia fluitans TaxID=41844 RepID=A0ABD1YNH3_9MARC
MRLLLSFFAVVAFAAAVAFVQAADPEELRDFAPPPSGTALNGDYFTFKGLRNLDVSTGAFANVTAVNVRAFPALSGLGVSNALCCTLWAVSTLLTLILVELRLCSSSKINRGQKKAKAYASFSSINPGTVSSTCTLFKTGISTDVLTRSFGVFNSISQELVAA